MQEQLITFETAKLAKEKGFDTPCHNSQIYYSLKTGLTTTSSYRRDLNKDAIKALTQSLLQKWLREVHNIHVNPNGVVTENKIVYQSYIYYFIGDEFHYLAIPASPDLNVIGVALLKIFDTYEQALEAGLQEALKLI